MRSATRICRNYVGFASLRKLPWCPDDASLNEARPDVAIVRAPFDDLTSGRPGARFGPRATRQVGTSMDRVGMDVVEVSPAHDDAGITSRVANRRVLGGLAAMAAKRLAKRPRRLAASSRDDASADEILDVVLRIAERRKDAFGVLAFPRDSRGVPHFGPFVLARMADDLGLP